MNKNIIIIGEFCKKTDELSAVLEKEFESCHVVKSPDLANNELRQNTHTLFVFNLGQSRKAEDAYLKLYRKAGDLSKIPHKTLLISDISESARSYELCREHVFDDYVCTTPLLDLERLKLAVFQGFKQLMVEDKIRESTDLSVNYLNNLNDSEENAKQLLDSTDDLTQTLIEENNSLSADIIESIEKIRKELKAHNIENQFRDIDIEEFKSAISDRTKKTQQYIKKKIATSKNVLTEQIGKSKKVYFNEYLRLQAEAEKVKVKVKASLNDSNNEIFFNAYQKKHQIKPSKNISLKDKFILIIDTDIQFTDFCEKTLKNSCKKVVVTHQAKTAIAQMKGNMPDLVVLDYHQPGLSSSSIFRMSSMLFEGKVAPIVISTSGVTEESIKKVIESGAIDVIRKPIEASALIEKLSSCVA